MHINSFLPSQLIPFRKHSLKPLPYPEPRGSEVPLSKVSFISLSKAAVMHSSPNPRSVLSATLKEISFSINKQGRLCPPGYLQTELPVFPLIKLCSLDWKTRA